MGANRRPSHASRTVQRPVPELWLFVRCRDRCCAGDEEEWREWKQVGDPVMHIELRRWADCLVIAPLSANTLAKCAQGLCDNLLTCVVSPIVKCLGSVITI